MGGSLPPPVRKLTVLLSLWQIGQHSDAVWTDFAPDPLVGSESEDRPHWLGHRSGTPVRGTRDIARTIEVSDMALATSGDYRHWREHDGATISHTIDPRTGRPLVNRVAAVTVTAATCAAADAWATALMVLGEDEGPAKAREFGLDALFTVRQAGDLVEIAVGGFDDIDNEPIRGNGE